MHPEETKITYIMLNISLNFPSQSPYPRGSGLSLPGPEQRWFHCRVHGAPVSIVLKPLTSQARGPEVWKVRPKQCAERRGRLM